MSEITTTSEATVLEDPVATRIYQEHVYRRTQFMRDFRRHDPLDSVMALASHVFDEKEPVQSVRQDMQLVLNEIQQIQKILLKNEPLFSELKSAQSIMNNKMRAIGQDTDHFVKHVQSLQNHVVVKSTEVEKVLLGNVTLNTRMGGVEDHMGGIEERLDDLNKGMTSVGASVEGLASGMGDWDRKWGATMTGFNKRIGELETTVHSFDTRMTSMQSTMEKIAGNQEKMFLLLGKRDG